MAKKPKSTTVQANAAPSAQKQQTFRLNAPEATSVLLAGDFTNWQEHAVSMRKAHDGVWQIVISLAPGTHHYRFLVDEDWRNDPECADRVSNPFGGEDCVRVVS